MSEMSHIHSDCSTARLIGKLMFLWEVIYVIPDPMQNGWLLTTIIQLYIKWNEHKTRQTTQHHHANVTLSPVNLAEFFLWIFCWESCFTGSWAKVLLAHNCRNVRDKQYSRLLYLYPRLALTHQRCWWCIVWKGGCSIWNSHIVRLSRNLKLTERIIVINKLSRCAMEWSF